VQNPELLMAEAYDEGVVSEVIRPAAIVPEESARAVLVELALRDVQNGGVWQSEPSLWSRYDRPWEGYGSESMWVTKVEFMWWARRPLHQLIFGGVFERFPELCVAKVERFECCVRKRVTCVFFFNVTSYG